MREDAAWSPILREQGALEELAAIGVEIIRNARNEPVSYLHLRAHETKAMLVCRLLLE